MTTFLPVVIVALVLGAVLVFFVRRSRPAPTDAPEPAASSEPDLPPTIHRVRANIRAILSKQYPTATVGSYGATHLDPRYFTVTINVDTDRQRDQIDGDSALKDRFRQALVDADYPAAAIPKVGFYVESQETVDRNFGGDWYQARK